MSRLAEWDRHELVMSMYGVVCKQEQKPVRCVLACCAILLLGFGLRSSGGAVGYAVGSRRGRIGALCDGVCALGPGLGNGRFSDQEELEAGEEWHIAACLTYLEAESTGLESCLREPSNDFPSEFVLNCCFEEFEFGWLAANVLVPFMAED